MDIEIPGRGTYKIEHAVFDYNGTIAVDGTLLPGVADAFRQLAAQHLDIRVLTADTYGTVRQQCAGLPVRIETFPNDAAGPHKQEVVDSIGGAIVCIGNGYNDIPMFDHATLSIAVIEGEGTCASLLAHADIVARSCMDALHLLLNPQTIRATLRH